MPRATKVRLLDHDPLWVRFASREGEELMRAAKSLIAVHQIGSTAIPTIKAKPVIDLLGVAVSLEELDTERSVIESRGYSWHGEYGLAGRRYCKKDDPETGERRFQLHCYAEGDPSIVRHLAFRDYLLANPQVAKKYEVEKQRCAALHPNDSHAYTDCKGDWIARTERTALGLSEI